MSDQTKPKSKSVTQRLLAFIKGNPTMARGKITEEYREGAIGADGTPAKLGPYYKIQGRCHGEHFTGRVAKGEVDLVKGQISSLDTFQQLAEALVDEAVARGEQERSALAKSIDESQSAQKKTSSRRVRMSGSRKPTPS